MLQYILTQAISFTSPHGTVIRRTIAFYCKDIGSRFIRMAYAHIDAEASRTNLGVSNVAIALDHIGYILLERRVRLSTGWRTIIDPAILGEIQKPFQNSRAFT